MRMGPSSVAEGTAALAEAGGGAALADTPGGAALADTRGGAALTGADAGADALDADFASDVDPPSPAHAQRETKAAAKSARPRWVWRGD